MTDRTTPDPSADGTSRAASSPEAPGTLGYSAALVELEAILADIERPDVDVDVLADKVQRAAVLIRLCRERIGAARLHIEQVITELDG